MRRSESDRKTIVTVNVFSFFALGGMKAPMNQETRKSIARWDGPASHPVQNAEIRIRSEDHRHGQRVLVLCVGRDEGSHEPRNEEEYRPLGRSSQPPGAKCGDPNQIGRPSSRSTCSRSLRWAG